MEDDSLQQIVTGLEASGFKHASLAEVHSSKNCFAMVSITDDQCLAVRVDGERLMFVERNLSSYPQRTSPCDKDCEGNATSKLEDVKPHFCHSNPNLRCCASYLRSKLFL